MGNFAETCAETLAESFAGPFAEGLAEACYVYRRTFGSLILGKAAQ